MRDDAQPLRRLSVAFYGRPFERSGSRERQLVSNLWSARDSVKHPHLSGKMTQGSGIDLEDKEHPAPPVKRTLASEDTGNLWRSRLVGSQHITLDSTRPLVQIAPQLKVMDCHFRMLIRQLTHRAQLWTEMHVDSTINHAQDLDLRLAVNPREAPIVCQLGGCDPDTMRTAAEKILKKKRFQGLNLNAGCPSSRVVDKGSFGAVLMTRPELARDVCKRFFDVARNLPYEPKPVISVKTRIGVDGNMGGEWLANLIKTIGESGARDFVMHARPAILTRKLTPAQNRSVPALDYDEVFDLERKLAAERYRLTLNGGVQSVDEVLELLSVPSTLDAEKSALHGIMLGRAASDKPCCLANVDTRVYGDKSDPVSAESRSAVLEGYMNYLDEYVRGREIESDEFKHPFRFIRPVVGLFHSTPASRAFRNMLDREVQGCAFEFHPNVILDRVVRVICEKHSDVSYESLKFETAT